MKDFKLTPAQLKELHYGHSAAKRAQDVRLAYRINAVILLGSDWTLEQVAEALLLDDETLRSYVSRYKAFGVGGLSQDKHTGSDCHLSASQLEQLKAFLDKGIRLSSAEPIEFVKTSFDVEYTPRGMGKLLKRLGYTYKKPKLVPGKANPEAQLEFLEDYQLITETLGTNDVVYFSDATHPTHNTMPAYGWIKKGERHEIKANSGRQRLNICGAINIANWDFQYQFEPTVNAESMLRLFKSLEAANPKADHIYVVLDNAKYNHSKILREYLQGSRVKPLYLPPYSPNLNLIERLWKFFNKRVLYNRYYEKFDQMKEAVTQFFANMSSYSKELTSLLTENFEIIGVPRST
jgi:transposase